MGGMSWEACHRKPVIGGLSWEACHGRPVMEGLSLVVCHGRHVMGGLSLVVCHGRPVIGGLSWDACHVRPVIEKDKAQGLIEHCRVTLWNQSEKKPPPPPFSIIMEPKTVKKSLRIWPKVFAKKKSLRICYLRISPKLCNAPVFLARFDVPIFLCPEKIYAN